jgi:hypothetical protein
MAHHHQIFIPILRLSLLSSPSSSPSAAEAAAGTQRVRSVVGIYLFPMERVDLMAREHWLPVAWLLGYNRWIAEEDI